MKNILLTITFLLASTICFAAPPARTSTYTSGTTIKSAEVTSNEDAIFSYLQAGVDTFASGSILNVHIGASAGIGASKLDLSSIAQNITLSGAWVASSTASFTGDVDISGSLDMNSKQIDNVLDPTTDQDAATKKYADGLITTLTNTTTGHDHDGSDSKTIPLTTLGTGTPGATNYLRGDGSWQVLSQTSQLFTATGTWTAPAGVGLVFVTLVGGGGGGSTGIAGGGGGAYAIRKGFKVTATSTYNVTVGAGGGSNIAGGASSFAGDSTTITANGGTNGGAGSAGGTASGTDITAVTTTPGSNTLTLAGGNGTAQGSGGGSPFGTGGIRGTDGVAGTNGTGYGSGGGGNNGGSGGSGAGGMVYLEW
jgi:hypothetical protein